MDKKRKVSRSKQTIVWIGLQIPYRILLSLVLAISMVVSMAPLALAKDQAGTTVQSTGSTLDEVRSLLEKQYAVPVDSQVLNAPTMEEMLKRLNDPYTTYFTAQEYQNFINTLNMKFTGVGVHVNPVPEGLAIVSVIPGSPAEEVGLQAGDIIIKAGGQDLAGMPSDKAVTLIRGPEGTTVELSVKRGTQVLIFNVIRKVVSEPGVTGQVVDGHIGYIDLNTFGADTSEKFGEVVQKLAGQVDSWVVDLRDNPGGYLDTAIDLAGYFIGADSVVQVMDRNNKVSLYMAPAHEFTLNKPVLVLTNENSASASEVLSGAIKDHGKAILVGNKTFGKGTVQQMFPLSDGGVLKMTIARFFSPLGHEINHQGITPDVALNPDDAEKAAELMLSGVKAEGLSKSTSGFMKLTVNNEDFAIALTKARSPEYWCTWRELIESLKSPNNLKKGSSLAWQDITEDELNKRWPLYYPFYRELNTLKDVPLDKKFTIHFSGDIDPGSVNTKNIELIASQTGERVPLELVPINSTQVTVYPTTSLKPGTVYWMVIHPDIHSPSGQNLAEGAVAVITTQGQGDIVKTQVRSFRKSSDAREDGGFGAGAILNLDSIKKYEVKR